MYKLTIKSLALVMLFLCVGSFSAQAQENNEDIQAQLKIFSSATESAVFDNQKIVSIRMPIADEGEKLFTFQHAEDRKSFTMTVEDNITLQVFLVIMSKYHLS